MKSKRSTSRQTQPAGDATAASEDKAAELAADGPESLWPGVAQDLEAVLDSAVEKAVMTLDVDALLEMLRSMSLGPLSYVMRSLGMRKAAKANRGMAAALAGVLRTRPSQQLLSFLFLPMLDVFTLNGLTREQWVKVTGGEVTDLIEVFEENPGFVDRLIRCSNVIPQPLFRAAIAVAAREAGIGVPAIAFLAQADPMVAEAYELARKKIPDLLPANAGFEEILPSNVIDRAQDASLAERTETAIAAARSTCEQRDHDDHSADPGHGRALTDAPVNMKAAAIDDERAGDADGVHLTPQAEQPVGSGATHAAAGSQEGAVATADALAEVDLLDWERAGELADRVADALHNGEAPKVSEVADLLAFTEAAHRIAVSLARQTAASVQPSIESIDAAVLALVEDRNRTGLLASLAAVSGPDPLHEAIAAVRALSRQALAGTLDEETTEALTALALLARAAESARSGDGLGYAEIAQHDADARAGLPSQALPVVTAALMGTLDLHNSADPLGTEPPPQPAAAAAGNTPAAVGGNLADDDAEYAGTPAEPTSGAKETARAEPVTGSEALGSDEPGEALEVSDAGGSAGDTLCAEAAPDSDDPESMPNATSAAPVGPVEDALDLSALDDFLRSADAGSLRIRDTGTPTVNDTDQNASHVRDTAVTEAPADGAGAGETADLIPDQEAVEAQLITQARYGLASMLHTHPSRAAARRLAAYQARLTSATGALAAAFLADQNLISRESLAEDRVGQLLAWASAARVAVLAPISGAAAVLTELSPCVEGSPNLAKVGYALATASLGGAIALPEHAGDVSAAHEAGQAAQGLAVKARELLETASQRAVKYAPANMVYQQWMTPEGVLGSLLDEVVTNDYVRAGDVRQRILEIRRAGDRIVDDTFEEVRGRTAKYRRIDYGARQRIVHRLEEVLDVAGAWADAATNATELSARIHGAASAARPLDKLRSTLDGLREPALEELTNLRANCDTTSRHGALEAATVEAVTSMIIATFATCTGHPPTGPEPTPEWVVRGELLGTDLTLEPGTLLPPGSDPNSEELREAAFALATEPAENTETLYGRRADRGEHDLTEVIVAALIQVDPDRTGPLLRSRRDADVAVLLGQVAREIDAVTVQVNSRRRDETLPEPVWSSLLAELEGMRDSHRRDFGTIRAALDRIRDVVEEYKLALVEQARARIEKKAAENPLVEQHRETLLAIVNDRGDVSGADEFLELLTSGTPLPETRADDVHLARFFPVVPRIAAANPTLLVDLHAALGGKDPTSPVAELFQAAHLESSGPVAASLSVGRSAVGAWLHLANRKPHIDLGTMLKPILAAMGLELSGGFELDKHRLAGRQFASLRGVHGAAKAMSPALGSDMGPGGNSLRVLLIWKDTSPTTLVDWLREEPPGRTVLVLYLAGALDPDQRRALAAAARGHKRPVAIVVDAALMAYLACQAEPSRTTLAFCTLPFAADSPYADRPGNTPVEMFYGRVGERQQVIDMNGPSFMSGGRQLGKSALLRSAEREFNKVSSQRAVLLDVRQVGADDRPEALWPMLDSELRRAGVINATADRVPDADAVSEEIRAWLAADTHRSLLVLVDEADNFLTADAKGGKFANVGACKRLMESEGRRVKFVFAGLHRTSRFESLSNQPLAHMGKPIVVGPLRPQAAQDLITRPMSVMGFTFADPTSQIARILAATNSVPSLLQLFGRALTEHLTSREVGDGPPQQITDDDIATVLDDQQLAHDFREKYILTLNLDHRYQVIVHAVALAAYENGVDLGLRLSELADLCRQYWPAGFADLPIDYLRGLVTECCDLGLLTLDNGAYRMRTPYVLRLLGTADEVAEVLFNAEDRLTLPTSLDAGSYRAKLPHSNHRSPLTARQIGRLLAGTGRSQVVLGTEALAVQRAAPVLEQVAAEGRAQGLDVRRLQNLTPEGLRGAASRLTQPSMLVMDLRSASGAQVQALLDAQGRVHAQATAPMTLVLVVSTDTAPTWVGLDDQLVELTRVDDAGLRLWAVEIDAPFHTPEELRDLGAATGGWPILIERALDVKGPTSADRCLTDLTEWLASPSGARSFTTACGLGDPAAADVPGVLAATFTAAAEWTSAGGDTLDVVTDLVAEDVALTQRVMAAGFLSVGDVLRTLRLAGMLVTPPGTRFMVTEPVLTRAVHSTGAVS
ncbi:hypothetical protein AB0F43_30930 [Kribbella sp. NPDC023972]|uniref:hypothetical protein n=1 Tax=Kribbella sp. NPDC023972 TaxID=3154795 RepID=UPI0033F92DD5